MAAAAKARSRPGRAADVGAERAEAQVSTAQTPLAVAARATQSGCGAAATEVPALAPLDVLPVLRCGWPKEGAWVASRA